MGGNYGPSVLYVVRHLSRGDVCRIGRHRLSSRPVPPGTDPQLPTIGVDCNNVLNVVGRYKRDPVSAVASFLEEWADHGCNILPVVDGKTPNAKQATVEHIATREMNRLRAIEKRQELRATTQRLKEGALASDERNRLLGECETLGAEVKKAETKAVSLVPPDFADQLAQSLDQLSAHETNRAGGRVLRVQQAEFQADCLLNHLHTTAEIDFVMSNDLDYPVQNGDGCIAIKVFTGASLTLSSTSRDTLAHAVRGVEVTEEQAPVVELAGKASRFAPVFEGIVDRRLRVLLAVIMGSDAWPSGVPDVGPSKLAAYVSKLKRDQSRSKRLLWMAILMDSCALFNLKPNVLKRKSNFVLKRAAPMIAVVADHMCTDTDLDEKQQYASIVKWAVKNAKHPKGTPASQRFNEDVINTLVDSIVYEPTNERVSNPYSRTTKRPKRRNWRYVVGSRPQQINSHLEEFASIKTKVVTKETVHVLRCKGPCQSHPGHNILRAFQHHHCSSCGEIVCKTCTNEIEYLDEDGKKKTKNCCIPCSFVATVVPEDDAASNPSIAEMTEELRSEWNFTKVNELPISELEQAWEAHRLHRDLKDSCKRIQFPLLPSSAVNSGEHWTKIATVDFSQGGAFINNLDDATIVEALKLLATFVEYDSPGRKYTDWDKDRPIFRALPAMYHKLTSKCRGGLGYRLLKRIPRHAFDSRTKSLDTASADMIRYNGELGICLSAPIPASMKSKEYKGVTVLTKDKLVASCCDCMSGGDKLDTSQSISSACVHTLPRAFLLSMLTAEDLAEHTLLELASTVTSANVETVRWNENERNSLRESILTLIEASGDTETRLKVDLKMSLHQILQHYRTGTQRMKEWNRPCGLPSKDEIGPITTHLSFDSPEYLAKMKMRGLKEEGSTEGAKTKKAIDFTESIVKYVPDYLKVFNMLDALSSTVKSKKFEGTEEFDLINPDFVGYKLVLHRMKKAAGNEESDTCAQSRSLKESKQEIIELIEDAERRSYRLTSEQRGNLCTPRCLFGRDENNNDSPAKACGPHAPVEGAAATNGPTPPALRSAAPCGPGTTTAIRVSHKRAAPSDKEDEEERDHQAFSATRMRQTPDAIHVRNIISEDQQKIASASAGKKVDVGPVESSTRKKKRSGGMRCAKCKVSSAKVNDRGFPRLPRLPKKPKDSAPLEKHLNYHAGKFLHNEMMRRVGKAYQVRNNERICSKCKVVSKNHTISFKHKGKVVTQRYTFKLCTDVGVSSSIRSPTKPLSGPADRRIRRDWSKVKKDAIENEPDSELGRESRNKIVTQQMIDSQVKEPSPLMLEKEVDLKPLNKSKAPWGFVKTEEKDPTAQRRSEQSPLVRPSLEPSEVKRRTGFGSALELIAYVVTVCNGDVNRIRTRKSSLTWFEEWFFFFEWSYGQTCQRCIDIESIWEMHHYRLNEIIDCKLALAVAGLQSWPRFVSFEEDKDLRKKGKWEHFDGQRVIMWDMTNISAYKFENAASQRATFSEYYAENCFKAGVGNFLCGWIVNDDLWGGGATDSEYNSRAGYLSDQEVFQTEDLVFDTDDGVGRVVTFVNIYDRGYRAKLAAWLAGKQQTLQPPSAKSDERFRDRTTVYAAAIARDRSGNERAVNVCKRSGRMKRGFRPRMNPIRFNYVWREWAFRANFMYKPIL